MWNFLGNVLVPAAIAGIFGVVAWIATNFFADPLLKFYRLRTAIHESLFFTANVASFSKDTHLENARAELRRHAAALNAIGETSSRLVRYCFRWLGYDVKRAARGLTGFSNSFELEDGSKAISRNQVETGLRFVRTYTDTEIGEIRKQNASRS